MDNYQEIDRNLDKWIDSHSSEIIAAAQGLIQIPSVKGEPAADAPYGIETVKALEYVLEISKQYGLSTKNLDGHAAHAEWCADNVPKDADIVGILAHVDVVPAGDGWVHPPFGAVIDDGVLYGRGAVDDKGPAIAGFYGMLAVKETGVAVNKRVRLILGADEESGFGCVTHYFANEEMPSVGFTPDATFPVVYAEKGITNLEMAFDEDLTLGNLSVLTISSGLRSNMVPDTAEIVLTGSADDLSHFQSKLASYAKDSLNSPGDLLIQSKSGSQLTITARGKSAHGSMPQDGVNAFVVLLEYIKTAGLRMPQILEKALSWAKDTTGGALGIAGEDEIAGPLTSNLGVVTYKSNKLELTFNIRYPVTWTIEHVINRVNPEIEGSKGCLIGYKDQKPLYVPEKDPLLTILMDVYREVTGDMSAPRTMGGGTYARVMRKGVAFGPEFEGANGGAHQPDEHWPVDHLIKAAKIYARAIARLANL